MATKECPKCRGFIDCDCTYKDHPFKAPGCQSCKKRYEEQIQNAKEEIAGLQRTIAEQQFAQKKLKERLVFLRLPNAGSSREVFKGDLIFVLHGYDAVHTILAHRFVLAGKSPVFYRMFNYGMLEDKPRVITIDDTSYYVMQAVINYCYTADIRFSDNVPAAEVLKVAQKYQITHLRDVCAEELCQRIDEKDTADMLRLSKSYEAKTLEKASPKYFKEHFDGVYATTV